ncbi:hypothetical protein MKZ38_003786 [Zalerion maritima]|uniref:Uncharacterized protein n=1 Tax=Zalerion maritima TaxID=339359 RepID=A0AAD5RTU7_9PEZI|nr:hypothetical protein MKZ38_003786 [Zalerion maritima]
MPRNATPVLISNGSNSAREKGLEYCKQNLCVFAHLDKDEDEDETAFPYKNIEELDESSKTKQSNIKIKVFAPLKDPAHPWFIHLEAQVPQRSDPEPKEVAAMIEITPPHLEVIIPLDGKEWDTMQQAARDTSQYEMNKITRPQSPCSRGNFILNFTACLLCSETSVDDPKEALQHLIRNVLALEVNGEAAESWENDAKSPRGRYWKWPRKLMGAQ